MPRKAGGSAEYEESASGESLSKTSFLGRWNRERWTHSFAIFGTGVLTGIGIVSAFMPIENNEIRILVGTILPMLSATGGATLVTENVNYIKSLQEKLRLARRPNKPEEL